MHSDVAPERETGCRVKAMETSCCKAGRECVCRNGTKKDGEERGIASNDTTDGAGEQKK